MDIAALRRNLLYDPETGIFVWRVSKRGHRRAGDLAGSKTRQGYWRVKVEQVAYAAHRAAWGMHHGAPPPPGMEVDHRNGDPLDNRIANLRLATRAQNAANVAATGVRYEEDRGLWLARICVNYKQINLGRFTTHEEAQRAYDAAKERHRGEFARVRVG